MMVEERFLLAKERIGQIKNEQVLAPQFQAYFVKMAEFLGMACENYEFVRKGGLKNSTLGELKERNYRLYEDILPANYGESYANPEACTARRGVGTDFMRIVCRAAQHYPLLL